MSIPLFAAISKEKRKTIFSYLAICGFALNCLIPFVSKVLGFTYNNALSVKVVSEYLLYVIVGYLLHEYELKRAKYMVYASGIIGLIIHCVGTYFVSSNEGKVISTYKGYNNLPCVLYSIAIFVLIKEVIKKHENSKVIKMIASLDKYTFSVYLMHYFIMDILVALFDINTKNLIYRVWAPIVIFAICTMITEIVRKIPAGKYLLP